MSFALLVLGVAAAVVAAARFGTDAPRISPYVDMRTPSASVRSYARALHAHRWHDACAHDADAVRTGDDGPCTAQLLSYVGLIEQLHVQILREERDAASAKVYYSATIGFRRGIATLALRSGQWLIVDFAPDRSVDWW